MGQGQDKIARNLVDLQPSAIVELFLLYFDAVDKENAFIAFHGGSIFSKGITWQGIEYLPLPVETEGFEITANGELPRPKIKISNKDYFISDLLIKNQDFQFAKVVRKRTFVKFLDDINFDGGNPWGEADSSAEISNDTYSIGQKTAENKLYVEFELNSPLDLENFELNNRLVLSRYCSWHYRGPGCNYEGPPTQTEDGRSIILNGPSSANWSDLSINNEWVTGKFYQSGDPVFLYNRKVMLNINQGESPSKIWYVSQTGHFSTEIYRPDLNVKYWIKDGCGKKINSCKLRFQKGDKQFFVLQRQFITNNYIDFSYLKQTNTGEDSNYFSTNVAEISDIETTSNYGKGYVTNNLIDRSTDLDWFSATKTGTLTLKWTEPQVINQINIYDSANATHNTTGVVIDLYNNSTTPYERVTLNNIPKRIAATNLSGRKAIFNTNKTVTSIRVSGSGVEGSLFGLSEVEVLKPSGMGLYFNNTSRQLHLSDELHIATWIQFPSGLKEKVKFNILHNISGSTGVLSSNYFSGINLYAYKTPKIGKVPESLDLYLDFSVSDQYQFSTTNTGQIFVNKSLVIKNWPGATLTPLHIEIYKGKATGLDPTSNDINTEGYIKMYSKVNSLTGEYVLSSNLPVKKAIGKTTITNFSKITDSNLENVITGVKKAAAPVYSNKPQYFKFKNPNHQYGIVNNLFLGINNYEWNNKQETSPIVFGTTAIWTGKVSDKTVDFFDRKDELYTNFNDPNTAKFPRKYSEILSDRFSDDMNNNLFAWWDMDISNSPPYQIDNSKPLNAPLQLTGLYVKEIETTTSNEINSYSYVTQESQEHLPFGGFPGTDRYGRE